MRTAGLWRLYPFSPGSRPPAAARRAGNLGANPSAVNTADAPAQHLDCQTRPCSFRGFMGSVILPLVSVGVCRRLGVVRRLDVLRCNALQDAALLGHDSGCTGECRTLLVFFLSPAMALALAHAQHELPRRRATDCKHKHRRLRTCSRERAQTLNLRLLLIKSTQTSSQQARYAAGVKDILEKTFKGEDLKPADIIVKEGKLAPQVTHLFLGSQGHPIRHFFQAG